MKLGHSAGIRELKTTPRASVLFPVPRRTAKTPPLAMVATAELDDTALLQRIAEHGDRARDAMQVFYARHVRYLYAVIRKHCQSLGVSDAETEDLTHDTFQRAFDYAASYRPSVAGTDVERQRWTRAWLGKIARNLLLQLLRTRPELSSADIEAQAETSRDSEPPSHHKRRLRALGEALTLLSERERDVLRVTAMHYRAGTNHQRLPNEASEELATRWQTTNENIRAIRSRALKRVMALTQQLMSEEPRS